MVPVVYGRQHKPFEVKLNDISTDPGNTRKPLGKKESRVIAHKQVRAELLVL